MKVWAQVPLTFILAKIPTISSGTHADMFGTKWYGWLRQKTKAYIHCVVTLMNSGNLLLSLFLPFYYVHMLLGIRVVFIIYVWSNSKSEECNRMNANYTIKVLRQKSVRLHRGKTETMDFVSKKAKGKKESRGKREVRARVQSCSVLGCFYLLLWHAYGYGSFPPIMQFP